VSPKPDYELNREREMGKMGNVPFLISEMASVEFAAVFIVAFPVQFIFSNIIDIYGFFIPVLVFVLLGSIALTVLQLFQRHRYRILCENREIEMTANHAAQRIGYHKAFEIWCIPNITQILTPLSTLVSRAIVMSEGATRDILARPKEGEIVVANAIADLDRNRLQQTKAPTAALIFMSLFFAWASLDTVELKIVISYFGILVLVLLQGGLEIRGPKTQENLANSSYETHPDIARILVFRGEEPREDEREKIREKATEANSERSPIKAALAYCASITVAAIAAYASYMVVFGPVVWFQIIYAGLNLLGPLLVFFIAFEVSSVSISNLLNKGYDAKTGSEGEIPCREAM
jgi:hypothetical protein